MADQSTLREPLLGEETGGRTESIAGRVLAACTAAGGRGIDRQRTLWRLKTGIKDGRERGETSTTLGSRLASPFVQFYHRFVEELSFLSLPAKAGLAASICSLLCFAPGPLSVLNKNGMWAVVTADVVLEANVGLTLSKGINRTLGTLAAALLALLVNFLAPKCGDYEPYFVIFWVFFGAALATMFKFRRPFKDRWNYAVAMSMITFHILILSKSDYKDKIQLPLIRLVTIIIGFLIASLVNMAVTPKYAGSAINELVAKNFERAGNVMERCVIAYLEGTVLEQVPDILAGKSEDDNIHMSFHEIVSADSEVDKLMKAVPFEPCHGKFFYGYPWDMYEDITDNLRYTLYDVVALDSCLRAEIQAPLHLRHIFEDEIRCIGKECAQVFRLLGESIREMRHVHSLLPMQQAEEGALLLQHKIAKYTGTLLGGVHADKDVPGKDPDPIKTKDSYEDNVSLSFEEALDDPAFQQESYLQEPSIDRSDSNRSTDSGRRAHLSDGHEDFLQRRESMSRHWDTTVQRISALSFIKFASLLIELVAKAKYVVTIVDELEHKGRFTDDETTGNLTNNASRPGNQDV
ncbi:unnamed protein product [Calypogeia fissa]